MTCLFAVAAPTTSASASAGSTPHAVAGAPPPGAAASAVAEAVRLRRGSVANRQVVALGRDLLVEGEALQSVAVLQGNAHIEGSVAGDVVVLGGSARLGPEARVEGDVYTLGGEIDAAPGAVIAGRTAAYPGAPSTLLLLLEGPALGMQPFSRPVLAAKLAAAFAWLLISLIVLGFGGEAALRRTRSDLWRNPLLAFFAGLTTLATLLVGTVLLSAFASPAVGIPTALCVGLLVAALKVWGTVAILDGVGGAVLARWLPSAPAPARLSVAVCGAALLKITPYVGTVVWSTISLVAVGAALTSRFGQEDDWIP